MEGTTPKEALQRLVAECLALLESEGPEAVEEHLGRHPQRAEEARLRLRRLEEAGLLEPGGGEPRFPERLGSFRLIERLGGGGMGVVYLAEQEPLGRRVALKLVRPDLLYFEGTRERFRREVEVVARLKHPGIVPVYTVGEEAGIPFYAMEHVEGRSLDDLLRALRGRDPRELTGRDVLEAVGWEADPVTLESGRPLSEASWSDACCHLILQVARALDHAHARGVLHRDLKPSNVMLAAGARALLLDFGLASTRGTTRLTGTGSQVGSLPYMAPEQLLGRDLDERTDLYALGVTLYELLTLRLPYLAADPEETRRLVLQGAPRAPREENPAVPWDVETVCLTAMELEAARRYPDARALADDLRAVLRRMPIAARRPGPVLRARRFAQRHPAWSVGLALGALLAAGSVGFGLRERAIRLELTAASTAKDAALREAGLALERASAAERRALEEADTTAAILAFLDEDLLRSASPKWLGPGVTVRAALDAAAAEVEGRFRGRPRIEAAVRTTIGGIYLDLGLLEEAERQQGRARELVLQAGATDLPVALENLAGLADVAFQRGRPDEALRIYGEVLAGRRALLGPDHPRTLVTLSNLGGILAVTGRAAEGEPLLAEAVREMGRVLGEGDLRTLAAMANLATALQKLGRIEEALALAERTVELSSRHLGAESSHTLTARHNVASILAEAGRVDEALAILQELEERLSVLGWAHPIAIVAVDSLAAAYLSQGRLAEAQSALERAFERLEAAGVDPGDSRLGHLHLRRGWLLVEEGRLAEAEEAYARAREDLARHLGTEHPHAVRALGGLAWVLEWRGDHGRSEELFARAIASHREGGELLGWRLGRVDALSALGRFEEAELELARAAEMLAEEDDARAPGEVLERAQALYAAWGRPEEIAFWRDELLGMER